MAQRASRRHDALRPDRPRGRVTTESPSRRPKDVVEELLRRQQAGDDSVLDDLVAADMVNHAAGPQGREGLRLILAPSRSTSRRPSSSSTTSSARATSSSST